MSRIAVIVTVYVGLVAGRDPLSQRNIRSDAISCFGAIVRCVIAVMSSISASARSSRFHQIHDGGGSDYQARAKKIKRPDWKKRSAYATGNAMRCERRYNAIKEARTTEVPAPFAIKNSVGSP
jgi:hypothetical protein